MSFPSFILLLKGGKKKERENSKACTRAAAEPKSLNYQSCVELFQLVKYTFGPTYGKELKVHETKPSGPKWLQKSDNLQYNMYTGSLGCWVAETIVSLTKHQMFQVLFFFMISCRILCKNTFNLFVYFF